MDCREMILSEAVQDFITDFQIDRLQAEEDLCYVKVGEQFNIVYTALRQITEAEESIYYYQNIPKLYGLMQRNETQRPFDPNNLIAAGITQVQRPPLELTGRGAIICIIDTGECVRVMSALASNLMS